MDTKIRQCKQMSKIVEEFRSIPGYENTPYRASSLHGITNGKQYLKSYNRTVTLRLGGKSIQEYVDVLVARAYNKTYSANRPYLFHLDGNWDNCAESNLMYVNNEDIAEAETDGWKYIPQLFPFYMAHPSGYIRSCRHFTDELCRGHNLYKFYPGKQLIGTLNQDGYYHVMISTRGRSRYMSIHRLVAATFLPNPDGLPQVNHIDGNKTNNVVTNLEWCSRIHNMQHARDTGLWSPKQCGQLSKQLLGHRVRCIDDDLTFLSMVECGRYYNMDPASVKESILLGRPRKGHRFEYVSNKE